MSLRYTADIFTDKIKWYLGFASKLLVKRGEADQGTDEIRININW